MYKYTTYNRAVATGGRSRGACGPQLLSVTLMCPISNHQSYICEFSKPQSFPSRKLMTSTNIRFDSLRLLKISLSVLFAFIGFAMKYWHFCPSPAV